MTYLQFFLWLTGIYSLYYLINILWDWSNRQSVSKAAEVHELTFIEQHVVEKIIPVSPAVIPEPVAEAVVEAVVLPVSRGLGGVTMANLFELARMETINLTTSVQF